MPVRVLIADDHGLFREGLRKVLEMDKDIVVIGEAENGDDAIECARRLTPDVLLLDIDMPGPGMSEVVSVITKECPGISVILLTVHSEIELVLDGLKAGAMGYAMKDVEGSELVSAIKKSAKGEPFIQACLMSKVLKELLKVLRKDNEPVTVSQKVECLTEREYQVLALIGQGKSNRAISRQLFISEKTVKNHVSSIFRKLQLQSRSEATAYAVRHGITGEV